MKPSIFRTLIDYEHRKWLGESLGLSSFTYNGIDLIDNKFGVEIKSRYREYSLNFAVHSYQIDYFKNINNDLKLFWAFLLYDLKMPIKKINRKRIKDLIFNREAWIFDWEWINQFEISDVKTGPYIYVGKRNFPDNNYFNKFEKGNGIIYLPKNSVLESRLNLNI